MRQMRSSRSNIISFGRCEWRSRKSSSWPSTSAPHTTASGLRGSPAQAMSRIAAVDERVHAFLHVLDDDAPVMDGLSDAGARAPTDQEGDENESYLVSLAWTGLQPGRTGKTQSLA